MIRANELRIGNLVEAYSRKVGLSFVAEVSGIKGFCGSYEITFWCEEIGEWIGGCNPIPLTAEWLERMGFVKTIEGGVDPDYAISAWTRQYPVSYSTGWVYFTLWPNDRGNNGDYLLDNYSSAPLKFVHQLQNLYFALTGEELQIKDRA